jgi:hypothetical protein
MRPTNFAQDDDFRGGSEDNSNGKNNRRSFDYSVRDEAANAFAQDDNSVRYLTMGRSALEGRRSSFARYPTLCDETAKDGHPVNAKVVCGMEGCE